MFFTYYTQKHHNFAVHSLITVIFKQYKMIDKQRQAELGSISVITSLIGPKTLGKAPIYMQSITATGEHLSYEHKRDNNKQDELRQQREQHSL